MACSTCNAIYRLPKELLYQHHQKEKWWAETPKTLGLFFSHHSHKWRRLYYLFCRPSSQRLAIYPSFPSADIVYSSSKCLNCSSLNAGDVVPFSLLLQQLPPSPFFRENTMGECNVQYVVVLYRSSNELCFFSYIRRSCEMLSLLHFHE